MNLFSKHILLLAAGLICAIVSPAQDIPVLPADPAIRTGTLPNGTAYYIVSNSTVKGLADFALVQKVGQKNIPDSMSFRVKDIARQALSGMPRCTAPSLQAYVTSHGVTPGSDGFVRVSENATEFRFKDVLLTEPSVLDSTLLVILDVIDRVSTTGDPFLKKWYSPSDQAVIVAGDVDAAAVEYKLQLMSMMTPAVCPVQRIPYVWESVDSVRCVRTPDFLCEVTSVSATWRSPRMPAEYMNTVQPAISEMFIAELGMVAEEELRESLRAKGIPVADVSSSFRTSAVSAGDESFSVNVSVSPEHFTEAVATLADVMSRIDGGYTSCHNLSRMKQMCIDAVHEASSKPIRNNSAYVDKCVAAYLYNGSLSTLKSKVDFLSSRHLADTTELRLFNGISSAILDPEKNLTLKYTADVEPDSVKALFDLAWRSPKDVEAENVHTAADIPHYEDADLKLKIKSSKTDPMSQGSVWTFSNGFKVAYKSMQTGGRLYYAFARNGGYSSVADLKKGEGGCFSDYLFLGKFGDLTGEEFLKVLNDEGISMESYVGLSNMIISGYAPKEKAGLMMQAILAVVNSRSPDPEAASYHAECLELGHKAQKGTRQARLAAIDSIMCPDYVYSEVCGLPEISDDLSLKADRFFEEMSVKSNDGVLVLLGDMGEADLKKTLLEYVGGFKTTDRAFRRSMVRYRPSSGCATYTMRGDRNCVDIAMSAHLSLTTDNFMAADIAAMVLQKHLSEAVMETGMYLTVEHECRIYPDERLNVMISMNEASLDGFASATGPSDVIEVLAIVRETLAELAGKNVQESEIAAMKRQLKERTVLEMKDPFYWLNAISRRYLAGKDFTTNFGSKIDGVTPEQIRNILSALNEGSKVEYIIGRN